jgi:hypothetical protein
MASTSDFRLVSHELYNRFHRLNKDSRWRELAQKLSSSENDASEVERLLSIFPLRSVLDEYQTLYQQLVAETPNIAPDGNVYNDFGVESSAQIRSFASTLEFIKFVCGYAHALNGLDGRWKAARYMRF